MDSGIVPHWLLSHNLNQYDFPRPRPGDFSAGVLMSRLYVIFATSFLLFATSALAQQPRLPSGITQGTAQGSNINNVPVTSGNDVQKQQQEALNQQRQLEIKRDTQKMLELTQELNTYLQKSNQNIVSVDALKKAEQIEKLARSVRSKMKQLY